jgi:hypothetical protein
MRKEKKEVYSYLKKKWLRNIDIDIYIYILILIYIYIYIFAYCRMPKHAILGPWWEQKQRLGSSHTPTVLRVVRHPGRRSTFQGELSKKHWGQYLNPIFVFAPAMYPALVCRDILLLYICIYPSTFVDIQALSWVSQAPSWVSQYGCVAFTSFKAPLPED